MKPPNIVLLHAHNTGRFIQPWGYGVPTPHLQRLAEEGVAFRKAFAAAPTCSPARAALMTGQASHTAGMLGLANRGFRIAHPERMMPHWFRDRGYLTVRAGLQHVTAEDRTAELGYEHEPAPESPWARDVIPVALAFLDEAPAQPFFLDVGIQETHREFPEAPADAARYVAPPPRLPDDPVTRQDAADFHLAAHEMDAAFGAVIDRLRDKGLLDNTIVVAFTDHGLQFPFGMCNLTDPGLETFFIVRGPGGFTGGKVVDALFSHVDLFPTLCELAGLDSPDWTHGVSQVAVVRDNAPPARDCVFGEVTFHAAYEPQRCIRTPRYKYIRRYDARERIVMPNCDPCRSRDMLLERGLRDQPRFQEALFDLWLDPTESVNRLDDPTLQAEQARLKARLAHWMERTHDPLLAGLPVSPPSGTSFNDPDGLTWTDPTIAAPLAEVPPG